MKKPYMKFYETGTNAYYLLKVDNELHLATESFIENDRFLKFLKPKRLIQGLKLIELTPEILMLFKSMVDCSVVKKDEDFEEMTTYEPINNTELRKSIEGMYNLSIDQTLEQLKISFDEFLDKLREELTDENGNINELEYQNRVKVPLMRYESLVEHIKGESPLRFKSLKAPKAASDNATVKKLMTESDFLYTQKIGSNYKITYLYSMDCYGTVTIYKIHLVKDNVKMIETFIYNIDIARELLAYMENNKI